MIPAPVTRSATTVPGSGIAVVLTEVFSYILGKFGVGATMGAGGTIGFVMTAGGWASGNCSVGSGAVSGDSTAGCVGATVSTVGSGDWRTTGASGNGSGEATCGSTTDASGNGSGEATCGLATCASGTGSRRDVDDEAPVDC